MYITQYGKHHEKSFPSVLLLSAAVLCGTEHWPQVDFRAAVVCMIRQERQIKKKQKAVRTGGQNCEKLNV